MATKAKNDTKPADARGKIVDALMRLASERRFEDISIRDLCSEAEVSLADFRDAFPSRDAVLAGFSRKMDRAVLLEESSVLSDESLRERLFEVLMRRLEAMAPFREGLREALAYLQRDLGAALAMNGVILNSMRFMMEAAGIEAEGGAAGAVKLQGLAFAWRRIVGVWLDDDDPSLSKTMAELDRELTRGERAVAGVDRFGAMTTPLKTFAQAAFDIGRRARERSTRSRRPDRSPNAEDGS